MGYGFFLFLAVYVAFLGCLFPPFLPCGPCTHTQLTSAETPPQTPIVRDTKIGLFQSHLFRTAVLNGSEVRDDLLLSFLDFFWQGRRTDPATDMVPLGPPADPKPTPQVPPGGSAEYHLLPAGGCLFRHALTQHFGERKHKSIAVWHRRILDGTGDPLWRTRFSAGDAGTYRCL